MARGVEWVVSFGGFALVSLLKSVSLSLVVLSSLEKSIHLTCLRMTMASLRHQRCDKMIHPPDLAQIETSALARDPAPFAAFVIS